MTDGSQSYLARLFGDQLADQVDLIAAGILVAVLVVVLLRFWAKLRRQTHMIHLQQSELDLQRAAAERHAMMNISDGEGRIIFANDHLLAATGWSAEDLIGKPARSVLLAGNGNDPDFVAAELRAGRSWSGESKLVRRDGQVLWTRTTIMPQLSRSGQLIKVVSLRTDITESKMRQEEGPIRAIFDRLQDEVYIFTVETLQLRYLNKRARLFHGWSEGEYQNRDLGDTDADFDAAQFRARVAPLVEGEVGGMLYESQLSGRPVEINLQIEKSVLGESRFIAVVRDITQRKEAEEARAAFIAAVTHELRSPLTSVKGAMKLIASGAVGEIGDKPARMVDLSLRNVERLLSLINDLLDLEKLDSALSTIRNDAVDLGALVDEAIAENAGYAGEYDVTLVRRPDGPSGLAVRGDRDRLIQVLTNLMSNAIKFSRTGGTVEVGIEELGEVARISVTDHGIGIPEVDQPRLFERFVQADSPEHRKRTGTGLGLSIVKTIVERHGGRVHFTSHPGLGTTFHVDLPREIGAASVAA